MKKFNMVIFKLFALFLLLTPSLAGADVYTKLLLHADRTGSSIVDSSVTLHSVTVNGDATQSADESKFGGMSAKFDGDGDFLEIGAHPDFAFGTGSFTIEFWIYLNSTNAYEAMVSTYGGTSPSFIARRNNNGTQWSFYDDIGSDHVGGTVILDKWTHYAVTREANTARMFIDGSLVTSWTDTNNYTSNPLKIGASHATASFFTDGFIDELRISNIARWTSNFNNALPTAPYLPSDDDTTPPVITLVGNASEAVEQGAVYTDDGATATDDRGGVITANIIITGLPVDTNTPGSYTITYNLSDAAGNAAAPVTRTVTVTSNDPPVISVIPSAVTLEAGATYDLIPNDIVGVSAVDTEDGDLTSSIFRGGAVLPLNTLVVGSQVISYNVSDTAGKAAVQKSRTVTIVDTTAPVCTAPAVLATGTVTTVVFGNATATDIVGVTSITNNAPISGFPVGTTVVTFTATDAAGNK